MSGFANRFGMKSRRQYATLLVIPILRRSKPSNALGFSIATNRSTLRMIPAKYNIEMTSLNLSKREVLLGWRRMFATDFGKGKNTVRTSLPRSKISRLGVLSGADDGGWLT